MSDTQTVFIVDDDDPARESLAVLLETAGFEVAQFSSGTAFLDKVKSAQNGCLLLDVRMPGLSGPEVQSRLAERNINMPVIIMTGHGDLAMAVRAMKAGAVDFLEKPFKAEAITTAVRAALNKSALTWATDNQAGEIRQRLDRLTTRERQVLDELVIGNLNKVIAYNLDISPRTVEIHRARAMEKMQARNLAHLVRLAVTAGAVTDGTP
ncbi:MAG: response regulator transcription factor [Marinosulfonomonas sp.]|nr:response regulator transcription factor [Marinosulfonomonas sp.]